MKYIYCIFSIKEMKN